MVGEGQAKLVIFKITLSEVKITLSKPFEDNPACDCIFLNSQGNKLNFPVPDPSSVLTWELSMLWQRGQGVLPLCFGLWEARGASGLAEEQE